jgi:L-amino acid N-acyltransferase YncA
MLRRMTHADAEAVAAIYNHAITDPSLVTADIEPVSAESRIAWMAHHNDRYPAFVWESQEDGVVAYSCLSPFAFRKSFSTIAEIGVYVRRDYRMRMLGSYLMLGLLREAAALGYASLVSLVFSQNVASVRGCETAGFVKAGELRNTTRARDDWQVVVVMQRDLAVADPPAVLAVEERLRQDARTRIAEANPPGAQLDRRS